MMTSGFPRARRAIAIAAVAAATTSLLGGCATLPASAVRASECAGRPSAGDASDLAARQASGAIGTELTLQPAQPVVTDHLEVSRQGTGSGPTLTDEGIFEANWTVAEGNGGAMLAPYGPMSKDRSGASYPVSLASISAKLPGIQPLFRCSQAGERIVAALPLRDLVPDIEAMGGEDPAKTVILAADITKVYNSSAAGQLEVPQNGMPTVVTTPSGRPGVTMPKQDAPADRRDVVHIRGFGQPISRGDEVTLRVSVFDWTSGKEIFSTWEPPNGILRVNVGEQDGILGATEALIGAPAGSQTVSVLPSAMADARAASSMLAGEIPAGRPLVFVIDVLEARSGAATPTGETPAAPAPGAATPSASGTEHPSSITIPTAGEMSA